MPDLETILGSLEQIAESLSLRNSYDALGFRVPQAPTSRDINERARLFYCAIQVHSENVDEASRYSKRLDEVTNNALHHNKELGGDASELTWIRSVVTWINAIEVSVFLTALFFVIGLAVSMLLRPSIAPTFQVALYCLAILSIFSAGKHFARSVGVRAVSIIAIPLCLWLIAEEFGADEKFKMVLLPGAVTLSKYLICLVVTWLSLSFVRKSPENLFVSRAVEDFTSAYFRPLGPPIRVLSAVPTQLMLPAKKQGFTERLRRALRWKESIKTTLILSGTLLLLSSTAVLEFTGAQGFPHSEAARVLLAAKREGALLANKELEGEDARNANQQLAALQAKNDELTELNQQLIELGREIDASNDQTKDLIVKSSHWKADLASWMTRWKNGGTLTMTKFVPNPYVNELGFGKVTIQDLTVRALSDDGADVRFSGFVTSPGGIRTDFTNSIAADIEGEDYGAKSQYSTDTHVLLLSNAGLFFHSKMWEDKPYKLEENSSIDPLIQFANLNGLNNVQELMFNGTMDGKREVMSVSVNNQIQGTITLAWKD